LTELLDLASSSPWAYVAIMLVAALDAVFPLVPSEATVISAGVLAGAGELSIALVIATGAAGALAGDNLGYSIGRGLGPRLEPRIRRSPKATARHAWARKKLATKGSTVVLVSRFIPGGRTATTLTAGLVRMPWRRFVGLSIVAGAIWASFAGLLGYTGGRTFEERPYLALAFALALAATAYVGLETRSRLRVRT
jgi:membrane-associated protein